MDVSIIIINYNTCKLTLQCLSSIYEKTRNVSVEIIVVDNASSDDSVSCIKEEFPYVILIENSINIGFGRANNVGVKQAKGKYFFLLNSDTILLNNAVGILFDEAEKMKDISWGALGGILYSDAGCIINYGGTFMSNTSILLEKVFLFKHKKGEQNFSGPFAIDIISGADIFIPKLVVDNIGLFDESFFMYSEDVDLMKRLALRHLDRYIIPAAKIIHLEGQSSKYISNKKRSMADKSLFLYIKKYSKKHEYYLFRILFLFIRLPSFLNIRYSLRDRVSYFLNLFACVE